MAAGALSGIQTAVVLHLLSLSFTVLVLYSQLVTLINSSCLSEKQLAPFNLPICLQHPAVGSVLWTEGRAVSGSGGRG